MNGEASLPCITWWNFNHFLVVERVVNNKFHICDPAGGRYRVGEEEFSNSYTGLNLSLSPNDADGNKPKDPVSIAASSDNMSPNKLSAKITSNCFGFLNSCIAQLSANI